MNVSVLRSWWSVGREDPLIFGCRLLRGMVEKLSSSVILVVARICLLCDLIAPCLLHSARRTTWQAGPQVVTADWTPLHAEFVDGLRMRVCWMGSHNSIEYCGEFVILLAARQPVLAVSCR